LLDGEVFEAERNRRFVISEQPAADQIRRLLRQSRGVAEAHQEDAVPGRDVLLGRQWIDCAETEAPAVDGQARGRFVEIEAGRIFEAEFVFRFRTEDLQQAPRLKFIGPARQTAR